ncbi:MAG: Holliday junction resolvase RuvX [Ruminococcaceae bacterium]|nr:Holliday junction resolvase RuvX [Oscillospiraceae bacterium]
MKLMSVDYGDVRTGIAFSDINQILASPYTVINESYLPKLIDKIADIVTKEKPAKIIVGLPRNMDGTYGYRCDECKELGNLLKEKCSLPVEYQDERLTTVMAHDVLSSNNVRGKKRKDTVDAVSAVMILQSYIDKIK